MTDIKCGINQINLEKRVKINESNQKENPEKLASVLTQQIKVEFR
jgi:hypothetical protein